ncbi:MAG: FadR family transcriptional regulator [Caulobacteraceae bacterium]|nr:MAG: FadR family transcriptional regulator [Caulobacteraceae bacterium]
MGVVAVHTGARDDGGSLVQRSVQAVTDFIREQGLRVGDSLPGEAYFATSLGVSRAVMREAFGAMAALHLIDVGNGRKPRVAALDGAVMASSLGHAVDTAQITVPEVWDVRRTIELRTVALAATHRTEDEARRIIDLAEAMAVAMDDLPAMTRHDIAFHDAIAKASHNALFVQIVSSFGPLMETAVPTAWATRATEAERQATIERHRAVARAIFAGDPAAAVAAMDDHFETAVGDVLKAQAQGVKGRGREEHGK